MTIDEAIRVMQDFRIPDPGEDFEDIDKAILLSIEALKQIKLIRVTGVLPQGVTLPGETEKG